MPSAAELATLGLVSKSQMDRMNVFYPRWNSDGTSGEIYDCNNQGPDGKTYQEFWAHLQKLGGLYKNIIFA